MYCVLVFRGWDVFSRTGAFAPCSEANWCEPTCYTRPVARVPGHLWARVAARGVWNRGALAALASEARCAAEWDLAEDAAYSLGTAWDRSDRSAVNVVRVMERAV